MTNRITVTIMAAAALSLLAPCAPAKPDRDRANRSAPVTVTSQFAPAYMPQRAVSFPTQMAAVAVSPSRAKSIALRAYKGAEFLDIKLVGGKTYIVRLIRAGQRFDVRIDARSGRIIG